MTRKEIFKVMFIIDEVMKKKEVVRYTYHFNTLIIWFASGERKSYLIDKE